MQNNTIDLVIVSRGDWLGKPANFKDRNNSVPAEVELTRHVTLTVHTTNKMADARNELFVFGDDFEAILNMLEEDETIEEHFSAAAMDVSKLYENFRPISAVVSLSASYTTLTITLPTYPTLTS